MSETIEVLQTFLPKRENCQITIPHKMGQNVYDDPKFFREYILLPRQINGLSAAPEWPTLRSWIPALHNTKFLDLGCGFGWACRWARENGAISARGIDLSQNMLEKAREFPQDVGIEYEQADLEGLKLPGEEYGVAFSSLALHYLVNLEGLVAEVFKSLKPGGSFIFSVEHPIYTAPRKPDWILDSEGNSVWPLDRYLLEGPRVTNWLAEGVVKQQRMISTYIGIMLKVGFVLAEIEEWGASEEQLKEFPDWARTRDRPPFLLFKVVKSVRG